MSMSTAATASTRNDHFCMPPQYTQNCDISLQLKKTTTYMLMYMHVVDAAIHRIWRCTNWCSRCGNQAYLSENAPKTNRQYRILGHFSLFQV